jgi:hypothetical protein
MRARCLVFVAVCFAGGVGIAEEPRVRFERGDSELRIMSGDRPLARYVFSDRKILRPYLTEVRALDGTQVTRNHPPTEGDATDHDTMHPGIWIAFGDISGADFWRNKAQVEHVEFVGNFDESPGRGAFTVRNRYKNGDSVICEELRTTGFVTRPDGYFILIDSRFSAPDHSFFFGDQEEMGLGVRVATPLAVTNGGHIVNSDGLHDEKGCWGKTALWADYSGVIGGKHAGVMVMPDPLNFRPSWFHARDYGFIAVNPFGRKAFTGGGEASQVEVKPHEEFRLGYGVYVYSRTSGEISPPTAYDEYLKLIGLGETATHDK